MAKLACDYIYGSNGNIVAIFGLDIAYRVGSAKVWISTWRPEIVPDPGRRGAVLLKTTSIHKVNVMPFLTLKVDSDLHKKIANCVYLQTFRYNDGAAIIKALDFGPKIYFADTTQAMQLSTPAQIPCGQLCSFLRTAMVKDKLKRMQRGIQAVLSPGCGKSLKVTPLEAWKPKEHADLVSGEAGETARSDAPDPT